MVSRIRILNDDISVWLMYAGVRRRFFETFQETNTVFLNLPGFDGSEAVFASEEQIRKHLAMSDAIADFVRGATDTPPTRNALGYNSYPYDAGSSEAKGFSADVGNIERLFNEVKPGDLIMSPGFGHFDPLLIGEITHAWNKADDLAVAILENEIVPTRKVRWLDVALARRDFPVRVSRRLQNQTAITKIDGGYYEEIFNRVYPGYVWAGSSKIDIFGDKYSSTDPTQPYEAARLIKYVMASAFAFEDGEFPAFQQLSIQDAIDQYYDEGRVEQFTQNFNSPGKFSLIAGLSLAAVIISAGILIASADPNGNFDSIKAAAISEVRHALSGDGKAAQEQALDNYVNSMSSAKWKSVQSEIGRPAKTKMGLTLDNSVEVRNHKAELNAK